MQKAPKKDPHTKTTRRSHFDNGVRTAEIPARHKITPVTSGGSGSSRKYAKGTHRKTRTISSGGVPGKASKLAGGK
jgi:hypothetical protein